MYNPVIGRWISVDPLGTKPGEPDIVYTHEYVANRMRAVLQPYGYVENNPVILVDPSGLQQQFPALPVPNPIPIPIPPVIPPGIDPHLADLVCSTQETWSNSLCDECPPCPCSDTKVGTQRVTPAQYQQLFEEAKTRLKVACSVKFTARVECVPGLPGFAVTCPQGSGKSVKVVMCFPTTLTYCQARALVLHEMTHAAQICNNSPLSVKAKEAAAYRAQCEELEDQKCISQNQGDQNEAVRKCVRSRTPGSTNEANRRKFDRACADLQQDLG